MGDILAAWDAARASEGWSRARPCFAYMLLSQALGLASGALRQWGRDVASFGRDPLLQRYEAVPLWIDGIRLRLLNEEILPQGSRRRRARST